MKFIERSLTPHLQDVAINAEVFNHLFYKNQLDVSPFLMVPSTKCLNEYCGPLPERTLHLICLDVWFGFLEESEIWTSSSSSSLSSSSLPKFLGLTKVSALIQLWAEEMPEMISTLFSSSSASVKVVFPGFLDAGLELDISCWKKWNSVYWCEWWVILTITAKCEVGINFAQLKPHNSSLATPG